MDGPGRPRSRLLFANHHPTEITFKVIFSFNMFSDMFASHAPATTVVTCRLHVCIPCGASFFFQPRSNSDNRSVGTLSEILVFMVLGGASLATTQRQRGDTSFEGGSGGARSSYNMSSAETVRGKPKHYSPITTTMRIKAIEDESNAVS